MKKILIVMFVYCSFIGVSETRNLLASPTYTKIVKSNRGLFGYKTVTQTTSSTGQIILACADPGWTGCRLQYPSTITSTTLYPDDIDAILSSVDDRILADPHGGNFVYNSDYLVIYTIDTTVLTDVTVEILTRAEAADRGYTI